MSRLSVAVAVPLAVMVFSFETCIVTLRAGDGRSARGRGRGVVTVSVTDLPAVSYMIGVLILWAASGLACSDDIDRLEIHARGMGVSRFNSCPHTGIWWAFPPARFGRRHHGAWRVW